MSRTPVALLVAATLSACGEVTAPSPATSLLPVANGPAMVVTPSGVTYTVVDLGSLGGTDGGAVAVNAGGQVAGWSSLAGNFSYQAFRWNAGTLASLGTLGGSHSYAFDINSAGAVTGWAQVPGDGTYHATLWSGGTVTDLGTLLGHTHSVGIAIGDGGHVVGESSSSVTGNAAFMWYEGVLTELPRLGPGYTVAHGVNSLGHAVGQSALGRLGPSRAVLWRDGVATNLGTLGGSDSYAYDINDAGQVIGVSYVFPNVYHGFIWQNGVMTDLGALGGGISTAMAINAHGDVAGYSVLDDFSPRAVLWRNGEMINLGTLPGGSYSLAHAINDAGQIVGVSNNGNGEFRAFLWEQGTMIDLGTLGGRTASPTGKSSLSNAGHVVGHAQTADGEFRPVLWQPFNPVLTVEIDIKPGSTPNALNPKAKGVIPVAILTTDDFDATTVEALTVRFGPGSAPEVHGRGHPEDVNGDGRADLVLHFDTQASSIACGSTSATLTGKAKGKQITGTDVVVTTGCR